MNDVTQAELAGFADENEEGHPWRSYWDECVENAERANVAPMPFLLFGEGSTV